MKPVEIVPGKAIGRVSLGALERELPAGAVVADGAGSADHVQFSLDGGRVDDVWIDDLATFPYDVMFKGQTLSRPPSLERLKGLFGDCALVPEVIGGIFYNCRGVTIGCDHEDRPMQLRLKPR
jgi:hypothetical protein